MELAILIICTMNFILVSALIVVGLKVAAAFGEIGAAFGQLNGMFGGKQ